MQGIEEISLLEDGNGRDRTEEGPTGIDDEGVETSNLRDETAINGVEDIWKVKFNESTIEDLLKFHFPSVVVAFLFYNCYASHNGFGARKSRYVRNKKGEIIQQTFLCYREGFRDDKFSKTRKKRKRYRKADVRCGCQAKGHVHVDRGTDGWYIKYLNNVYKHTLVEDKYVRMLPVHRKMSEYDITVMNDMKKVGIKTPHIFGQLASQVGGYVNVRFKKQDMYNVGLKQRKLGPGDANEAVNFLDAAI